MIIATLKIVNEPGKGGGLHLRVQGSQPEDAVEKEILEMLYVAIGGLVQDLQHDPRFKHLRALDRSGKTIPFPTDLGTPEL